MNGIVNIQSLGKEGDWRITSYLKIVSRFGEFSTEVYSTPLIFTILHLLFGAQRASFQSRHNSILHNFCRWIFRQQPPTSQFRLSSRRARTHVWTTILNGKLYALFSLDPYYAKVDRNSFLSSNNWAFFFTALS